MIEGSRTIVAADYSTLDEVERLAWLVGKEVAAIKVGNQLAGAVGARKVVGCLAMTGNRSFRDGKWVDIPNTVAETVKAEMQEGLVMFNVMCSGGVAMMTAAKQASVEKAKELGIEPPKVLGVTVLTSLNWDDLHKMGLFRGNLEGVPQWEHDAEVRALVVKLAKLAQEAGLDGVIASAQEAPMIRTACGPDFLIVTPGIRLPGADAHDQKRVVTPYDAISAGADYLVVGRDITQAKDPKAAVRKYNVHVEAALRQIADEKAGLAVLAGAGSRHTVCECGDADCTGGCERSGLPADAGSSEYAGDDSPVGGSEGGVRFHGE